MEYKFSLENKNLRSKTLVCEFADWFVNSVKDFTSNIEEKSGYSYKFYTIYFGNSINDTIVSIFKNTGNISSRAAFTDGFSPTIIGAADFSVFCDLNKTRRNCFELNKHFTVFNVDEENIANHNEMFTIKGSKREWICLNNIKSIILSTDNKSFSIINHNDIEEKIFGW